MRCPPVGSRGCSRTTRRARRIFSGADGRTVSFAGPRERECGPAQAAALRPPVPRLQEADVGDGGEFHLHRSHVPLRNRYRALHLMTSHSNGMSALQLQRHLGLGSYKSAWMLVRKIRRAMDVADGFPLVARVQADETSIPYRLKGIEPITQP